MQYVLCVWNSPQKFLFHRSRSKYVTLLLWFSGIVLCAILFQIHGKNQIFVISVRKTKRNKQTWYITIALNLYHQYLVKLLRSSYLNISTNFLDDNSLVNMISLVIEKKDNPFAQHKLNNSTYLYYKNIIL